MERFKDLAKKRYKIESKNSELKNPHGYNTAESVGLFGLEIQGATDTICGEFDVGLE